MKTAAPITLLALLPVLAAAAPDARGDSAPIVLPASEGPFLYSTSNSIGPFVSGSGDVAVLARPGKSSIFADAPWRWTPSEAGYLPMPVVDGAERPWLATSMSTNGRLLGGAADMGPDAPRVPVVWSADAGFLPGFEDLRTVRMTTVGFHVSGLSRGDAGIPAGLYRIVLDGVREPLFLSSVFEAPSFYPTAVNGDATVVVGSNGTCGAVCNEPWIVDAAGLRPLPVPEELLEATPYLLSEGGSIAIGTGWRLEDGVWYQELVRWTDEVAEVLPLPEPATSIELRTASTEGDVIAGSYESASGVVHFVWREGVPVESHPEYLAQAGFDKVAPEARIFAFSLEATHALVAQIEGLVLAGELLDPRCGVGGSCFEARFEPGCANAECCTTVCELDPFCCAVWWDETCVSLATERCSCGGEDAPACFAAHAGTGCSNPSCCALVCTADPFCCETEWDAICVARALESCAGCGDPAGGSCLAAQPVGSGATGCADGDCCAAICGIDPFCCETEWDAICAGAALTTCGGCGDPANGGCLAANATPSCAETFCCVAVCEMDLFCCTAQWDEICVQTAGLLCAFSPGDLDGDGVVNAADLSVLLGNWGASGPSDLDDDGTTNAADLSILLGNWG